MENSLALRPMAFSKLLNKKYLMLELLMHIEFEDALKFMFILNTDGRKFLVHHFKTVKNGFENEGLITYLIDFDHIDGVRLIEKLYL